MNFSADKKRAIVTGANSGIGKATALSLAQAGIDLALVGRSIDCLEEVAIAAQGQGVDVETYAFDLLQLAQIREKFEAIAAELGQVDVLINNAGMGYTHSLEQTSLADWQQVIDLNLTSSFQVTLGVLPRMRQQQQGQIINVSSTAAKTVFPEWGAYCVSKAALNALSPAIAAEECANGIRVTTVMPGAVNTPIWDTETVDADFDRAMMLTPENVAETILQIVQLPASANIEEIVVTPSAGAL
ncbi:SDR family oxidoreductase [[Limnothrix rosea] IAM M-220]|uniref:SDR family oxidoreductase n=1 Tax=[Limnothrix rosea] IAM M-220 TaxID=454133 RepID=UPI00095CEE2B|nr:SDR family oxidoreductase [[Limnothrix rosea] IAM M-220]OKH17288.1 short-chain dehydrogenase [[Limnothrix rosea] IAM M-220]